MELRFRPTFQLPLESPSTEIMERLKQETSAHSEYEGQFCEGHALISVQSCERHFWSPWLHLDVRLENESSRILFGRFSPHPSIWTAFVFSYLTLAVLSFFAIVFGWSQLLIKQYPWAFFIIPGCLVLAGILWGISQIGQRLANSQMVQLHDFVNDSVR